MVEQRVDNWLSSFQLHHITTTILNQHIKSNWISGQLVLGKDSWLGLEPWPRVGSGTAKEPNPQWWAVGNLNRT